MNISHIAFWTRDIDVSSAFWCRHFNAKVGPAYHSTRRPGFISRFVTMPDSQIGIELMTGPWVQDGHTQDWVGWDHVAISLHSREAVDLLAKKCDMEGLLVSAPRTTGDGFYEAVIATPDGARIEITV